MGGVMGAVRVQGQVARHGRDPRVIVFAMLAAFVAVGALFFALFLKLMTVLYRRSLQEETRRAQALLEIVGTHEWDIYPTGTVRDAIKQQVTGEGGSRYLVDYTSYGRGASQGALTWRGWLPRLVRARETASLDLDRRLLRLRWSFRTPGGQLQEGGRDYLLSDLRELWVEHVEEERESSQGVGLDRHSYTYTVDRYWVRMGPLRLFARPFSHREPAEWLARELARKVDLPLRA